MSFLWHDYETFGTNPATDKPCQFAALRTDDDLNPVGEPLVAYCAPARDVLPHPMACLVTGITPQHALKEGVSEVEFARSINQWMSQPGTCSAGYNSLRFDDEVTRNLLYRNLMDPYEREWRNGNSRWDVINLARMCYALRPEGLEWPMVSAAEGAETRPSFRLEDLSAANEIAHEDAHDALSDVHATIELARRLRKAQPRLFDWALQMRDKARTRALVNPAARTPLVHTSGRIPASRGCTTLVLPIVAHPDNDKAVIVFDLMGDAEALAASSESEIRDRVFTASADLPEGVERLPLKAIKTNAVPMVAPENVLQGIDLDRIGLDPQRCARNQALIERHFETLQRNVRAAFESAFEPELSDPELMIYSGGFFDDHDRRLMQAVHRARPEDLGQSVWDFHDSRLPLMLLRLRARNWPDTLTQEEWNAWEQDRQARLTQPPGSPFLGIERFRAELEAARQANAGEAGSGHILDQLEAWSLDLGLEAHISNL